MADDRTFVDRAQLERQKLIHEILRDMIEKTDLS
jgi:hypothetical protein